MNESLIIHKKWLHIKLPQDLTQLQLEKLIHVCTGSLTLRIGKKKSPKGGLELLCKDSLELAEAEALIYQVLVDERLREKILINCEPDVNAMIDNVIMRALGK